MLQLILLSLVTGESHGLIKPFLLQYLFSNNCRTTIFNAMTAAITIKTKYAQETIIRIIAHVFAIKGNIFKEKKVTNLFLILLHHHQVLYLTTSEGSSSGSESSPTNGSGSDNEQQGSSNENNIQTDGDPVNLIPNTHTPAAKVPTPQATTHDVTNINHKPTVVAGNNSTDAPLNQSENRDKDINVIEVTGNNSTVAQPNTAGTRTKTTTCLRCGVRMNPWFQSHLSSYVILYVKC